MNWKIFIVCHDKIHDCFYNSDSGFNNENFQFVNVSPKKLNLEYYEKYSILDSTDIPNYTNIGKWYTESEVIYNIYMTGMYDQYDYIGFIHWDKDLLEIETGSRSITEKLKGLMTDGIDHISLETHDTTDYFQNILADVNKPNTLTGVGTNCYDYILADINKYQNTNLSIEELMNKKRINLCSCFFLKKKVFLELMKFAAGIIESKKLEVFDTLRNHRLQGGLMERYFGTFLALQNISMRECNLVHRYQKEWR